MEADWKTWVLPTAVPLIIIAVGLVGRFLLHVVVTGRPHKWFNQAVENTHNKRLEEARSELERLDRQQDDVFFAAAGQGSDIAQLLFYIAQELTRIRSRLDVMRIEQWAQYDTSSIRAQFSDLQVIWSWVRECGNPNAVFDIGTKVPLMDLQGERSPSGSGEGANGPTSSSAAPGPRSPFGPSAPDLMPTTGAPPSQSPQIAVVMAPPPTAQVTEQLERLGALLDRGLLTNEEFLALKSRLFSS